MSMKKWLVGGGVLGAVTTATLVGRLLLLSVAQGPAVVPQDQMENPSYTSSILVDPAAEEGASEADELAALQSQAKITADEAATLALAANPGASEVQVELDNENGSLAYSVELDNGSDVKVDAGNGTVLSTDRDQDGEDQDGADPQDAAAAADDDDVQEEVQDGLQDGPDDASEVAGAED